MITKSGQITERNISGSRHKGAPRERPGLRSGGRGGLFSVRDGKITGSLNDLSFNQGVYVML